MFKYRVKKNFGDIETNEIFLDKWAKIKEDEFGLSEKRLEVPLQEKIAYILIAAFFVLAIALFSKTFYLQVVNGQTLKTAAENNKGNASLIIPERGIIYDSNMKKLVSNSPAFDLVCDKRSLSASSVQADKEIEIIAQALSQNYDELKKTFQDTAASEIIVLEDMSHEQLLIFETKIQDIPDCQIKQSTKRDYLYGNIFSQILGYTSRINRDEYGQSKGYAISDTIGKQGLEKYYETYLRGVPGQLKTIRLANGQEKSTEVLLEPTAGYNLILNIDANLQQKAYEALESSIKNLGAKKGAAVAINPKTGAILALVSYPSYDNNLFSGGISQENFSKIQEEESLFNRAIAGQYPTGSTIKPFEAIAALQEKIISPDKQINDIGYIEVPSQYDPSVIYRYEGVTPHGWVDMREAIAVSSNIYFYTVGGGYKDQKGLGSANIKKWLELFGWGQKTGIDLPGEVSGLVPDAEYKKQLLGDKQPWTTGDTYNLSIGQSYLKVSPIQVAAAYVAIANGGTIYKPQIVNKIVDSSGNVITSFEPVTTRTNFFDQENLKVIREGMYDCVHKSYGSAVSLNDIGVDIAAKTGTAETGRDGIFNTWVSAFAPYDDPQIVFVTTIEGVAGLRSATLPVAHDVLDWYFNDR